MTVIWSGVTEEGAVVPVQVTAEGKVVAVGDGPEGDYLKLTGGNLTGDLTVNEQITLATNGSASFSGKITQGNTSAAPNSGLGGTILYEGKGGIRSFRNDSANGEQFGCYNNGAAVAQIMNDGSATFAKDVYSGGDPYDGGADGVRLDPLGAVYSSRETGAFPVWVGYTTGTGTATSLITAGGKATFTGDVVIGSRGEQWLIRESNGVAMLVQQTLRQPRMEKLRDLPNELDLIEAALSEIMEKLRMTPPAGWPVWDGQSEATTDNDNA